MQAETVDTIRLFASDHGLIALEVVAPLSEPLDDTLHAATLRPMLILGIIVFGMAAGWIAQLILGRGSGNWGEALVAGLIGSFVGGLLASLIAGDGVKLRASGIIGTIVGAIIVLAIWGAVRGRTRGPAR
jgi:uncharacterized membrane protein YeaQ/YmgE (transglycosylase-associated protein family)